MSALSRRGFTAALILLWLGSGRAAETGEKGRAGEQLMDGLLRRSARDGGLGMDRLFDPAASKIALGGTEGGTGFDGVYKYFDQKSGQYRYAIGEAKWGTSRLGEFEVDLLDEMGNPTGKKTRYFQGSVEWVENVLHRMRTRGSEHDIAVANELAKAIGDKRIDFLTFRVDGKDPSRGSWEIGPLEPGATTPRPSYRGAKGVWDLDNGKPRIGEMKFGKVGCSACEVGSRFFEAAVRRKVSDAQSPYSALATPDENVNPNYLVPDDVALDEDFKRQRTGALADSDAVKNALDRLPEEQRAKVRQQVSSRAGEHFELEKKQSLIDRQRYWQAELPPEGRVKVARTRSLVDELKGDSKGLKVLQRAMMAGALAQLAWTYYEGGHEALLYAMGQMLVSQVQDEVRDAFWIWALRSLAARGIATGVADTVVPMIESGGLAAVLAAADLGYTAGHAFGEGYIYSEQYDAEALRITGDFLSALRSSEFAARKPPVTFVGLCDQDVFVSKEALAERLELFKKEHHYTQYPESILQQVGARLQSCWLQCKGRELAQGFFDLPGDLTPVTFCKQIDKPEEVQARIGHIRSLIDPGAKVPEADWTLLAGPIWQRHKACLQSLPIQDGLSAAVEPGASTDLARLEEKPAEPPRPSAMLLAVDEEMEVEQGAQLGLQTQALAWGLPGAETTLRLQSEIQTSGGQRRQLQTLDKTFTYAKDAFEPEELTRLWSLQDAVAVDEELAAGPAVYTVRLLRGSDLLASRAIRLVPKKKPTLEESIVLLLDASGSMQEDQKLEQAKASAKQVLAQLRPGTEAALIVYYDCGSIVVEQDFTTDPAAILAILPRVQPSGSTPLAAATVFAKKYLQDKASGKQRRLVILTDGKETCGGDPIAAAQAE
jgi:VWA domain-containing protein